MRPDPGTGSGISEKFSFLELLSQERVRCVELQSHGVGECWLKGVSRASRE